MSQQIQVAKRQNTRLARGLIWIVAAINMVLLLLMCANASHGALLPLALLAVLIDFGVASFAASQGLIFELKVEHTWKKVCSGLGGSFVGIAACSLRRVWHLTRSVHSRRESGNGRRSTQKFVMYMAHGKAGRV